MPCGQSNCPCAKVPGCEAFAGAPFSDCRYDVQAGAVDGAEVGAGAYILIRHSWSGIDGNCEADPTQLIEATFTAAAGDVIRLHVDVAPSGDSHYAELTINPDGETLGTLKLSKSGPELVSVEVDAPPGTHTLKVCYDQVTLTALLGDERLEADSEGWGGLLTAVSTGDVADAVGFSSVRVSHKLYETACDDCAGEVDCSLCATGRAPSHFLVTIFDHCWPEFNASYILPAGPPRLIGFGGCPEFLSDCGWLLSGIPFPRSFVPDPNYQVGLFFAAAGSGLILPRVYILGTATNSGCGNNYWAYQPAEPIAHDCLNFEGEIVLPFHCYANGGFGLGCSFDPCAPDESPNLSYARFRNI